MDLDKVDRKILKLIQRDASLTASEIAERVNLSQPPCWRRIKRLEEAGYIRARVGLLNRQMLGLNTVIYTEVKLTANGRQELHAFEERIREVDEVTECYVMLGRVDFLLRIVTKDMEHYERLYRDVLSQLPGVQEFNSSVAMSEIKLSTELPLDAV
ncbi:Lrp/AsnC family transcriptional regulator [uncultured Pseudoteredinibacter sp.]|uniref:Lrp/AsnC family transcriptional regulator n=1 Tax=uncultured Pseudoteredinibacter sp. TaxID=1641701 RepID=UPI00262E94F8|nr:Lrp/AsnC family transcriptional regulator [uncultured Pseudoteredinibacter sp.]MCV6624365.1 Lrp/AsnC family transcriptional regulator [Cellvibrionaceae bacterium]